MRSQVLILFISHLASLRKNSLLESINKPEAFISRKGCKDGYRVEKKFHLGDLSLLLLANKMPAMRRDPGIIEWGCALGVCCISHLNTVRSITHTTASTVAATVAFLGQSYIRDISPKQSPRSFMLTLTF